MSHKGNDLWLERRRQWLEENRATYEDIGIDSKGEFINSRGQKIYFPPELQDGYEDFTK